MPPKSDISDLGYSEATSETSEVGNSDPGWKPVRRPETRQIKDLEQKSDSVRIGFALEETVWPKSCRNTLLRLRRERQAPQIADSIHLGEHLMRRFLVLIALMLAQVSTAKAEDCGNQQTQASMNECANEAFKKADSELNAVYKEIKDRLKVDADKTGLLTTAQRAWVAYRDGECKFSASGVSGGSAYPFVHDSCLTGLTEKRIGDLKVYAACQEGDLSCPVSAK